VWCVRCILEASYELHDAVFFQNLGTILLYAVIVCPFLICCFHTVGKFCNPSLQQTTSEQHWLYGGYERSVLDVILVNCIVTPVLIHLEQCIMILIQHIKYRDTWYFITSAKDVYCNTAQPYKLYHPVFDSCWRGMAALFYSSVNYTDAPD